MHFHDFFGDGQSQSGSCGLVGNDIAHLLVLVEDRFLIGFRNPGALVLDLHRQTAPFLFHGDRDLAGVGELDRIGNQVDDDLHHSVGVRDHLRQVIGNVLNQMNAGLGRKQPMGGIDGLVDDAAGIALGEVPVDLARFHLGNVQHIVDELRQAIALGDDDFQVLIDLFDGTFFFLEFLIAIWARSRF